MWTEAAKGGGRLCKATECLGLSIVDVNYYNYYVLVSNTCFFNYISLVILINSPPSSAAVMEE